MGIQFLYSFLFFPSELLFLREVPESLQLFVSLTLILGAA